MASRVFDLQFLEEVWRIARRAGEATLEYHRKADLEIQHKADDSPVTAADLASQQIILAGLKPLAPEIPWLAEEETRSLPAENRGKRLLWLVDPLDGTREFVAGRDEFTVNIALIENGRPRLGVVVAPALGVSYFGMVDGGAFRFDHGSGERRPIEATGTAGENLVVVASRSHRGDVLDDYLERLPPHKLISIGSSLKFCLVAEGRADLYPRLSYTMEWDVAAAHAVLSAAGGEVLEFDSGEPLRYDRPEIRNPFLIAVGRREIPWRRAMRPKTETVTSSA